MANVVKQPINIIFEKAGTLMLRKRATSGVLSTASDDIYVANEAIIKSIKGSMSKEMTDIETGNSIYPADKRPKKVTGKFDVTMNAFDRQLHRFATGATKVDTTTNATFPLIGIEYVVPNATPYEIILPYSVSSIMAIKDYETGVGLTQAATTGTAATGEYDFVTATNKITFNADMAGKKVTISYMAKASETSSDVIAASPIDNTYELIVMGDCTNLKGASGAQASAVIFDSVKFTGDITPPERSNTPGDWSVSMEIVKPFGDKAIEYKYVDKTKLTAYSVT